MIKTSSKIKYLALLLIISGGYIGMGAIGIDGAMKYRKEAQRFDNVRESTELHPGFREGIEDNKRFFNYYSYGLFGLSALSIGASALFARGMVKDKEKILRGFDEKKIGYNPAKTIEEIV